MMLKLILCFCKIISIIAIFKDNVTLDYVPQQLPMFKLQHPKPIGLLTTDAGNLVDIRKTFTLNSVLFENPFFTKQLLHLDKERISERNVHAKGNGAHGYFEVTHDVSKYTKADVFNGIGKKTPVFGRFSTTSQDKGGNELSRESKALAIKFYTREGNLDHLCLHQPVFHLRNPKMFQTFVHADKRSPNTNIHDFTKFWDFRTLQPDAIHTALWLMSEYGIPDGYRKMDIFPIHTFEINNKHGDLYYVRFNYRTEQGLANLTSVEAAAIASQDRDYFTRDVYNAIENKIYPAWRLEMDIMTLEDIAKLHYNPFDLTKMWEKGTYKTVQVGRLVFDKNVDNFFRESELSAFAPGNLVPGINGAHDAVFISRVVSYPDTQHYRLGPNHVKIEVNRPYYSKYYFRDGKPPVSKNMKDAPNYHPNSFNGPLPYIDTANPTEKLLLLESNAVDLGNAADFYNHVLVNESQRRVLAQNVAATLDDVLSPVKERVIKIMSLVHPTLGARVAALAKKRKEKPVAATRESYAGIAQCMKWFTQF